MRGLYAIIDVISLHHRRLDPLRFAAAVLSAKPAAIQLRDKRWRAAETLQLLRALRRMCDDAAVLLFANDRADLAALAHCDGVHVGQDDLPPSEARRMASWSETRAKVGLSLHNADQLQAALASDVDDRPDYLAFGPVFDTSSKIRPDPPLGIDTLRGLAESAAASGLPRVAIGGIDLDRAADVAAICPCVAVISALLPAKGDHGSDAYTQVAERTAALVMCTAGAQ
jgi:thiamine-phosphate pyrophosphorylase